MVSSRTTPSLQPTVPLPGVVEGIREAPLTSGQLEALVRKPRQTDRKLRRRSQQEAGQVPRIFLRRPEHQARQLPDGSWEGPYVFSSQEDFSDSMPENWVNAGPGPKRVLCKPIPMHDTTERDRAWLRRQKELGRTPTGHKPYTLWSATQKRDGT